MAPPAWRLATFEALAWTPRRRKLAYLRTTKPPRARAPNSGSLTRKAASATCSWTAGTSRQSSSPRDLSRPANRPGPRRTRFLFLVAGRQSAAVRLFVRTRLVRPRFADQPHNRSRVARESGRGLGRSRRSKISPDGHWISFLREHDVWVANVATGAARQLTRGGSEELRNGELDWVYPEELDLHTAYWWSPDSSHVAFLQLDERHVNRYPLVDMTDPLGATVYERYPAAGDRNPIARVGVVAVAGGAPRWMDTGADSSVLLARVAVAA